MERDKDLDVRALWPVYSAVVRRGVFVGTGADGVMALYAVEQGRSGAPRRLEPNSSDREMGGLYFSPDGPVSALLHLRAPLKPAASRLLRCPGLRGRRHVHHTHGSA